MQDSLTKERHYDHSIDEVWAAISEGSELSRWFIQADFKAEVGYRYTFTHEETKVTGEVLEANPVTDLVYSWKVNDVEVYSTVRWTLTEKDGGTLVTLVHSDISNYPEETAAEMMGHFSKGWDRCINDLADHLRNLVETNA